MAPSKESSTEDLVDPIPSSSTSSDEAAENGCTTNSGQSRQSVLDRAFLLLSQKLQPHLPLNRSPGQHTFKGVDLVDHDQEEQPFNEIGLVLFAAEVIENWGNVIDSSLKTRIDRLENRIASSRSTLAPSTTKQLVKATRPHQAPSQPLYCALKIAKSRRKFGMFAVVGGGMVFMKEIYVRRLELENHVYRRHLQELEESLRIKVVTDVQGMLKEVRKSVPRTPKKPQVLPPPMPAQKATPKRKAAEESTDSPPKKPKKNEKSVSTNNSIGKEKAQDDIVDLTEDVADGETKED